MTIQQTLTEALRDTPHGRDWDDESPVLLAEAAVAALASLADSSGLLVLDFSENRPGDVCELKRSGQFRDLLRGASRREPAAMSTPNTTQKVLDEIDQERTRQDAKWGEQNCHDFEWVSILTEEVGETAQAANEANFTSGKNRGDWTHLREELVQVAAVAVAWIECIDRRAPREHGSRGKGARDGADH